MTAVPGHPAPRWFRPAILVLVALILFSCTASAYFAIKSGHPTRAASTFFAGLAFSALFIARLPRRP